MQKIYRYRERQSPTIHVWSETAGDRRTSVETLRRHKVTATDAYRYWDTQTLRLTEHD